MIGGGRPGRGHGGAGGTCGGPGAGGRRPQIAALLRAAGEVMADGESSGPSRLLADARSTDSLIHEPRTPDEGLSVVTSSPWVAPRRPAQMAELVDPLDRALCSTAGARAPDRGRRLPPAPGAEGTSCSPTTSPTPRTPSPRSSPPTGWPTAAQPVLRPSPRRPGAWTAPGVLAAEAILASCAPSSSTCPWSRAWTDGVHRRVAATTMTLAAPGVARRPRPVHRGGGGAATTRARRPAGRGRWSRRPTEARKWSRPRASYEAGVRGQLGHAAARVAARKCPGGLLPVDKGPTTPPRSVMQTLRADLGRVPVVVEGARLGQGVPRRRRRSTATSTTTEFAPGVRAEVPAATNLRCSVGIGDKQAARQDRDRLRQAARVAADAENWDEVMGKQADHRLVGHRLADRQRSWPGSGWFTVAQLAASDARDARHRAQADDGAVVPTGSAEASTPARWTPRPG